MDKTGIIILAAGSSSRLGRPKQLLLYQGKTLLSHVIDESRAATLEPVMVVTGAHHPEIQDSLIGRSVEIVFNPSWETGMASGIVAGVTKILVIQPHLHSLIVAVCDQPHISARLFQSLAKKQIESGKGLIASLYSGIAGTPVLFDRYYFNGLLALTGDAGARQLLKRYPDDVATVHFPKGETDIDTEADFQRLSAQDGLIL